MFYLTENILLSLYTNQKIIAAYFQNHTKHTTALCLKKLCDFYFTVFKEIYFSLCLRRSHKRGEYL
jgi:hypothetical protein